MLELHTLVQEAESNLLYSLSLFHHSPVDSLSIFIQRRTLIIYRYTPRPPVSGPFKPVPRDLEIE